MSDAKSVQNNTLDVSKIPTGDTCNDCPYHVFLGYKILHRKLKSAEEIAKQFSIGIPKKFQILHEKCSMSRFCDFECWSSEETSCLTRIVSCKFLNITDEDQETLLWDKEKQCNIKC